MQLFKQQKQALDWAKDKDHFPCFMEMRTGKSLVCANQVHRWGGKTLMIAPISTWYDWEQLLRTLNQTYCFLEGSTIRKKKLFDNNADWVVINPEGVTRWGNDFFSWVWDANLWNCVLDESVFIKNPRAKVTKLLLKHKDYFSHRMLMTGVPIAEQTEDIVTQLIWCLGEFLGYDNFYKWRIHYMKQGPFRWYLKKGVAQLIREELKRISFVMSAKDAGLFTDQVKQTRIIELPLKLRKNYEELEQCWKLGKTYTKYGVVKDAWLAMLSSGIFPDQSGECIKAKLVKEICDNQLEGQQVVVFSRWRKEVKDTAISLDCPDITGDTPIGVRKEYIRQLRNGKIQYLVCQSKTVARGLDLSCVNNAIMCSNYWEYEKRKQITSRMNHPNRKIPSLFIDIIAKDTIEEKIHKVLDKKRMNARSLLQRLKVKVK